LLSLEGYDHFLLILDSFIYIIKIGFLNLEFSEYKIMFSLLVLSVIFSTVFMDVAITLFISLFFWGENNNMIDVYLTILVINTFNSILLS